MIIPIHPPTSQSDNLICEVIFKICCSQQNSTSYDQKYELSTPIILSGTIPTNFQSIWKLLLTVLCKKYVLKIFANTTIKSNS